MTIIITRACDELMNGRITDTYNNNVLRSNVRIILYSRFRAKRCLRAHPGTAMTIVTRPSTIMSPA